MRPLWPLVVVAGCASPLEVTHERPMQPPAVYANWYAEAEDCLGTKGNLGRIKWFVASELLVGGVPKAGVLRFPDRITMSDSQVTRGRSVKHEMVHHITQQGDGLHDSLGRVACETAPQPAGLLT